VGRTLLSAAFDLDLDFELWNGPGQPQLQKRRTRVSAPHHSLAVAWHDGGVTGWVRPWSWRCSLAQLCL